MRTPPRCSPPVGDGAKRTRIFDDIGCKDKGVSFSGIICNFEKKMDMEATQLQKKMLNKVKTMSLDQLSWLERVLSNAPFTENELDEHLVKEIMSLQENGGSFDFLNDEPENYSVIDCQFIYDVKSDSLLPNELFKS